MKIVLVAGGAIVLTVAALIAAAANVSGLFQETQTESDFVASIQPAVSSEDIPAISHEDDLAIFRSELSSLKMDQEELINGFSDLKNEVSKLSDTVIDMQAESDIKIKTLFADLKKELSGEIASFKEAKPSVKQEVAKAVQADKVAVKAPEPVAPVKKADAKPAVASINDPLPPGAVITHIDGVPVNGAFTSSGRVNVSAFLAPRATVSRTTVRTVAPTQVIVPQRVRGFSSPYTTRWYGNGQVCGPNGCP